MKVDELIHELNKLPIGTEVCIVDIRKNCFNATGEPEDGTGHIGIQPHFKVEMNNENVSKPFASLVYENDDYTEDCSPDMGALLCETLRKEYSL